MPITMGRRCNPLLLSWAAPVGIVSVLITILFTPPNSCCSDAFLFRRYQSRRLDEISLNRQPNNDFFHHLFSSSMVPPLWMARNDDVDKDKNDDYDTNNNNNPRNSFGRQLRGLQSTGLKGTIVTGDTVICRYEIPSLGIWEGHSYELQSIYAQKFIDESQTMERIVLQSLDDPIPPGYDRYITLYSPSLYNINTAQRRSDTASSSSSSSSSSSPASGVVIVTPEEVGLVSVRTVLVGSVWLAIPGFFWVFVAMSFYNYYHEKTGGTFLDAFWGR